MKAKRVNCECCVHFVYPVFEDEHNMISPIKENAKCKLGKRVMFRQPIFPRETSMVAINDYGWIRYCSEYNNLKP
jgi:hypothetical protein